MIDDRINRTARRVAIHQAIDEIVDAHRRLFGDGEPFALSNALRCLSVVEPDAHPDEVEGAWRAVAAIAQGQLEQAMEERAR